MVQIFQLADKITVFLVPKINHYWIATDTEFKCPSIHYP
jgi:hypothetical protein